VGDDGKDYDPIDMPQESKADGLQVRFTATNMSDYVSYHMWGYVVRLVSIERVHEQVDRNTLNGWIKPYRFMQTRLRDENPRRRSFLPATKE
jgi:hypothetical protein